MTDNIDRSCINGFIEAVTNAKALFGVEVEERADGCVIRRGKEYTEVKLLPSEIGAAVLTVEGRE